MPNFTLSNAGDFMNKLLLLLVLLLFPVNGICQTRLLERPDLLEKIKSGLNYTYDMDFDKAREVLYDLSLDVPHHPVVSFLEALIIYWENYPLTPANPKSDVFIDLLEETIAQGKNMLDKDPDSLEGLFFELFARALFSEYWADNGKPSKVFPYLNALYRQTMKGMEVQDQFKEFYFTGGLYNYYMEAYPEKHPSYKPIKLLFHPGDKQKGLIQLNHCAENAVYVKNEARFFLTHIYMCYESNPSKASEYAAGLYREFPRNPLFVGKYAEILIYNNKLPVAEIIVNNLAKLPGDFALMQFHLYKGILNEKYRKDYESAFAEYNLALQLSEKYGDAGSNYNALAWMGLGRYYLFKNDPSRASHYFRLAENVSSYDYVTNDK
jgi:hypothetical protein